MGLFDWLTKRQKPLSRMTRSELRRQELLLEKDRMRLFRRVEELAGQKQDVFTKGATEKSIEVRRMLAQEFDLKTTEQLMVSRQLNIRSKELLTVARLRMLRENIDRARKSGSKLGMVSERDLIALERMIDDESVTSELYQDRLDSILTIGEAGAEAHLSDAGQQVLDMWDRLDTGLIKDESEAYDEADRRVRERLNRAAVEGG
ncbi:MAG: hypothetical protein V3T70_06315 [Phycisphaerae bacterium]